MNTTTDTPRTLAAIDRVYGGSDTPEAVYRNPITDLCRDLERENARLRAALETIANSEYMELSLDQNGDSFVCDFDTLQSVARAALAGDENQACQNCRESPCRGLMRCPS